MKTKIENFRWWLADTLSKWAVNLRGQKWYDINCYGVHGNRAAEIASEINFQIV